MSEPVDVYPYPEIKTQPNSSHSNGGSYGKVFIVLAVIFAVSVMSCVVSWLCNRRRRRDKEVAHHHHSHQAHHQPPPALLQPKANGGEQNRELGPKEWEAKEKPRIALRERADVEFGFDRRAPSARVASYGGGMAEPPRFDGGRRPEVRFADNV